MYDYNFDFASAILGAPMIRLTIQTESETKTVAFDKPIVVIGSGSSEEIDLSLPDENLQNIHVKILEQNGKYSVLNVVNDPFVTLNSLPFGKKTLINQDVIQIGQTLVRFEGAIRSAASQTVVSQTRIHEALERTIASARAEDVLADDEIDELIREVENLSAQEETNSTPEDIPLNPEPIPKAPEQEPVHPEDSYVYEIDDESTVDYSTLETKEAQHQEPKRNWNFLLIVIIAILTMCVIGLIAAYITISERSEVEKMTAAEGVADVAMALTYADVHHIKPQKQNWSDPKFIKNNLSSILSPEYPSFANIDNQGQFTNCKYILRVYTSTDLSQFLVIAQPAPSLLQWLIPKTSIIVDSNAMEIRNIDDLKAINRLLLEANTLDGANGLEISELVKQGTLIPLKSLATKRENPGFAPPKALALIKPGAENLIYNAPRYYHFGESILMRATNLMQVVGNSYEVARLKQELKELSNFQDMVLYTSEGMQKALQAQKALATLAPHNELLTAYLNFDAEGVLINSHLLLNDDYPLSIVSTTSESTGVPIADNHSDHNVTAMVNAPTVPALKFDGGIDHNHPLYLQLMVLVKTRQQALKPINEQIVDLLNTQTDLDTIGFGERLSVLLKQYKSVDKQQREKITEGLKALYTDSGNMPLAQFAGYVTAAGLDHVANSALANHAKATGTIVTPEQIKEQMQKIQEANTFSSLEKDVRETAEMLSLSRLPNAEKLILLQNEMKIVTLQRLRTFILSPSSPLKDSDFEEANRALLSRILETAWVSDHDEYEYYMHEFEMRMNKPVKLSTKQLIN